MLVELDIFSGRPNPRWELDEPAGHALVELEERLSPAEAPAKQPPPLGYRGFVYALGGETRRAFLGQVQRRDCVLGDPGFSIERLLLESMPADLAPIRARVAPLLSGGKPAP